ncbi:MULTISPECIES: TraR/DksA C4-type zinc finger protein [unclassified Gilliamella]|nr:MULTISPECIES: TraR/DksA C4-type zinc finger protein [unclassified Gilliamella]
MPDERRRAIPGCSLCIDCQREEELRGRNFV